MEISFELMVTIINYAISSCSIIYYIYYGYFLFSKTRNFSCPIGQDTLIRICLLLISLFQSSYDFFVNQEGFFCYFLGCLDIFLDFSKMSISIILSLIISNDNVENENKISNTIINILHVVFSLLLPLAISMMALKWGEIAPINISFCYPTEPLFRIIVFFSFFFYYLVFFLIVIYIMKNSVLVFDSIENKETKNELISSVQSSPEPDQVNKIMKENDCQIIEREISSDGLVIQSKRNELNEPKENSQETVNSTDGVLSEERKKIRETLIKFSLVQLLKLFILIVFVLNFFCERYLRHDELLYHIFVESYLFKIVAILIENISIPLFMYVFGNFVIGGNDLKNKTDFEISLTKMSILRLLRKQKVIK